MMNKISFSFVRRVLCDQSGQVLPWVVGGMVMMLGMAGLTIDVGHAYVVRPQIQGCTNAMALAAASDEYSSSTTLTGEADLFDCGGGGANTNPYATGAPTVESICVQALEPSGTTCTASSPPNAVLVSQTASVPTTFMRALNILSIPIKTTSIAALAGPVNPWNVAIIEDGTGSMSTTDSDCGGVSQYACALNGIQELLQTIKAACPGGTGASCAPATSNLRVAMFYFPNVLTTATGGGDLSAMNACTAMTFTEPAPFTVYTLPLKAATSYSPMTYTQGASTWTASYEITYGASDADANGFVSDYYDSADASTDYLNPSSSIVQAIGYGQGTKTGCLQISEGGINLNNTQGPYTATTKVNKANVGEGITYYASVIYAAQAALTAEQTLYPGSKNAMILLSDGQANTQWFYFPYGTITGGLADTLQSSTISATLGYSTMNTTPSLTAVGAYYLTTPNQEATALNANTGKYPDFFDECQQAINAGMDAQNAGTTVFTIAYGAENTGCASTGESHPDDYTDITLVTLDKTPNVSFTLSTLTPCVTMEDIASSIGGASKTTFFGVQQSGGSVDAACTSADQTNVGTAMNGVMKAIGSNFVKAKLLPSSVSYVVTT
jgi:hypothetical protein